MRTIELTRGDDRVIVNADDWKNPEGEKTMKAAGYKPSGREFEDGKLVAGKPTREEAEAAKEQTAAEQGQGEGEARVSEEKETHDNLRATGFAHGTRETQANKAANKGHGKK